MNKTGFTLIELLVVVMIIGVLTAVALPQYAKAVERSKAVEALSTVRAMKDAQEMYYLANGVYAARADVLDIEIPPSLKNFNWDGNSFLSGRFALLSKDRRYYIVASGVYRSDGGTQNVFYCCARSADSEHICQTFGTTKLNTPTCGRAYQIN